MQPSSPQQPSQNPEQSKVERPSNSIPDQKKPELMTSKKVAGPAETVARSSLPTTTTGDPAANLPVATGAPAAQAPTQTVSEDDLPAEDVDVIEKEWVDRAENIIKTTANDPFVEEQQEESLSKEYLKKRFNVDVDDS